MKAFSQARRKVRNRLLRDAELCVSQAKISSRPPDSIINGAIANPRKSPVALKIGELKVSSAGIHYMIAQATG
jgi:hypothetical protein